MNIAKIPKPFKNYENAWFINFINTFKFISFDINKLEIAKLIDLSNESNIKIILYTIHQMLVCDSINPPTINPKPTNGIELKNPNTSELFGIYHIHLNDGFVLLWYLIWNESGQHIKFNYLKHPPSNDNYKTIIKEIYKRNDDGYNLDIESYFINSQHILNSYINEKIIMTFKDFIKNL